MAKATEWKFANSFFLCHIYSCSCTLSIRSKSHVRWSHTCLHVYVFLPWSLKASLVWNQLISVVTSRSLTWILDHVHIYRDEASWIKPRPVSRACSETRNCSLVAVPAAASSLKEPFSVLPSWCPPLSASCCFSFSPWICGAVCRIGSVWICPE